MGPIPFTAIVDYTRLFEIPEFEEFCYVIRRLDQTYLDLNSEDTAKPVEKEKGKQPSGKR